MRSAVVLSALALSAATCWAGDIKGKWGLGVDGALFRSGEVHGALIFGHSSRTAWLLDVYANGETRDVDGSSTGRFGGLVYSTQSVRAEIGPRIRRFTRPDASWSPYWDVFAAATHSNWRDSREGSSNDSFSTGAKLGAGLGVEYFTPWHFSVAAHSDVLTARYARVRTSANYTSGANSSSGYEQSLNVSLRPALELRAYF